ncbi:MAG: nucleoside-diphosphate kinase [Candidatus Chisholmbacteria bacterium RIFCSPHIGHO2_01_FULL_49_18]|uniref:Nucleoside diphosphate kinase n=2 Tax=Candidatus Chisholmiibacteriota TaxID=1817900 RepID=A0A1G1VMA7_9BACT|nr:MAG: nucleoside-diphosphate kinase [Candidatus Chisholmbacteria bacterium RIFCSPHIGHO2_01_FULL_49_18]OGY21006.1 MAG: nucleoside-diphosphate kinase [Candidatus Chisholmbacteria bacterium RIFCSPLOWO2_01_FULL_49_14]
MQAQRSVVMVKPDGLQRGLVGEIISRFERKGLKLVGIKMLQLTDEVLEHWYAHHKGKPFFPRLVSFMKVAPVVAMLWEGLDCVQTVRMLTGITKAREAEAGSIRGDLAVSQQLNLIHASDSIEMAQKEEKLIFSREEIFEYKKDIEVFVYSEEERE